MKPISRNRWIAIALLFSTLPAACLMTISVLSSDLEKPNRPMTLTFSLNNVGLNSLWIGTSTLSSYSVE
ncbi:MAG: hypothetical protein H7Y42_14260 [Chitinophagaceae bacterium]|nr:hypothetical protein [Chitinophagaceae bacterium]